MGQCRMPLSTDVFSEYLQKHLEAGGAVTFWLHVLAYGDGCLQLGQALLAMAKLLQDALKRLPSATLDGVWITDLPRQNTLPSKGHPVERRPP